ncbi:Nicotinate-nucleotide--dimethylbenzimidazole phosphoribosyltransferase [Marinobacter nitratireducens]|uniref:Nicotinate-nucleotide--dimethylbenzimidazole phosphoribosyltransferase n=1 Tax=Marinobacter nitratireducens TaxID=1137280 RepID=A0A072MXN7_9GAMM|nr:nicotinate-nucleotide--dimethylbenzimidazole phosphoribosyltransferase [Marinobacter nitratireducens]KEF30031.1 Nicotinate-nucleotide--dimethylbenzimidazole phosphoribosyltransferase [Marinobacter nitratireducens]
MTLPSSWTSDLALPESSFAESALTRQGMLTKPPGSLGRLEELAITLSAQQRTESPAVDKVHISVFAGDHGVCREGISAFPQAVTAQMIANFAHGGAAISVLARQLDAHLEVVNLGTVGDVPPMLSGVVDEIIAPMTGNLASEPAMSPEQVVQAVAAGDRAAERAANAGAQLFIGGDMGIGNTTSAAALACALLNRRPDQLAGPGTGLDADGVSHKARVIARALARQELETDPLRLLASLGGFEITALAGAYLGAAARGIPVLVDGYIVSVAALAAVKQQPALRHWLHFSHQSAEPGHRLVLDALEADPLLDLGMRLGEGSGAATAVPLLRSACALHNGMASFADAGVSEGS